MKNFTWKNEDQNQWLNLEDAIIAHNLVPSYAKCLEIGTWKGGWILSLLENDTTRSGVCVDPYPGLEYIREMFLTLANQKAPGRFVLYSRLEEIQIGNLDLKFDVIHIDGVHSQDSVAHDLRFATDVLSENGMLIVDDIFYHDFPGVTAAVFQLMEALDLAPFLFSKKKLYLCNNSQHDRFYKRTKELVFEMRIKFSEDQKIVGAPGPYMQSSSINNFPLIILDEIVTDLAHTKKLLGIRMFPSAKSMAKLLLPPVFLFFYRKIRGF